MAVDTGNVKQLARRAEDHDVVERLAKAGLAARAVVWLLIGALAATVALGGEGEADQGGALRAVAGSPGGTALLLLLAAGFAAYAGYRLLCAAVGHRDEQGRSRVLRRLKSLAEALLYGAAAASCVRTAVGSSPNGDTEARSLSARALQLPAGRYLLGLAGAVAVVVAVVLLVRALRQRHSSKLDRAPTRWRRRLVRLGVAGLAGRSLAIALIGGFVVTAAWRADADQAKGLDAALRALAEQPAGPALLLVAAASFACYGLWSFAEALWRDV